MTKHSDSTELTRLSGEQAEERTAREIRKLMSDLAECAYRSVSGAGRYATSYADLDRKKAEKVLAPLFERIRELESLPTEWEGSGYNPQQMGRLVLEYRKRQTECSRLASRVEELEKLIAKHSGSLNSADSAPDIESSSTAKETR